MIIYDLSTNLWFPDKMQDSQANFQINNKEFSKYGYTYTKNNYHLPVVLIKLGVLCFYLLNLATLQ